MSLRYQAGDIANGCLWAAWFSTGNCSGPLNLSRPPAPDSTSVISQVSPDTTGLAAGSFGSVGRGGHVAGSERRDPSSARAGLTNRALQREFGVGYCAVASALEPVRPSPRKQRQARRSPSTRKPPATAGLICSALSYPDAATMPATVPGSVTTARWFHPSAGIQAPAPALRWNASAPSMRTCAVPLWTQISNGRRG